MVYINPYIYLMMLLVSIYYEILTDITMMINQYLAGFGDRLKDLEDIDIISYLYIEQWE